MTLQGWTNVAMIVGTIVALVGLLDSLKRCRDALSVSAEFGLAGDFTVDSDGARWIAASVRNAGAGTYVHDVRCAECVFVNILPEKCLEAVGIGELESSPRELSSLSK